RKTNTARVMCGQAKASTPKMTAARPRKTSAHQLLVNTINIFSPSPLALNYQGSRSLSRRAAAASLLALCAGRLCLRLRLFAGVLNLQLTAARLALGRLHRDLEYSVVKGGRRILNSRYCSSRHLNASPLT